MVPRVRRGWTAALVLCLAACETGGRGSGGPILDRLTLDGNHAFSSDEIESRLATSPSSWLPFERPHHFNEALFQSDLDRIVSFYQAHGYFSARVLSSEVVPTAHGAVRVTVHLDEGLPSRVSAVQVEGISDLPLRTQKGLRGGLPLKVGDIFTEAAYRTTKDSLREGLLEQSFVGVQVDGRVEIDPRLRSASVTLTVSHGPQYRYGEIVVQGNERISSPRIEREVREVVTPGALYHGSQVEDAQRRVFDLGVLSAARVFPGKPDPAAGTVPLIVRVREAPFHTTRLGAGIGLDVEHEEVHVTAGYTDRDFLGGLRRLDFDNKLALVWIPTVFSPQFAAGAPAGISTLQLTEPELFAHGLDLTASLSGERAVEEGFEYWALRGRLAAPWRINQRLTVSAAYAAEFDIFQNSFNGIDLSPTALLLTQASCPNNSCLLSYLEQSVVWDGRDDPLEPHRGLYAALSVQEGGGPLGGDFSYLRIAPEVRGYLPLGPGRVLAARLLLGGLSPLGGSTQTPVTQRFFLGGLDSVRGYGSLRLSPMVRVNTCSVLPCHNPGNSIGVVDIPVGGDGMLEGTLELRNKITEHLGVVAFVDAGEVTLDPWQFDLSPGTLAITPGLGLRLSTPLGALRADFAYRLTNPVRPILSSYDVTPSAVGQAAVDTCPYPYGIVAQTGWGNFTHPSASASSFLNRFGIDIAIGEAF